ncbi:hypothetical protein [Bifidobacterium colobi]|uniref:hypothetical protein n=1 Tax=Bifidobacterium colobi TaxID=2809026 RepID=UPI001F0AD702|nr:hypothetical protein [Bifidobacterium colobi]
MASSNANDADKMMMSLREVTFPITEAADMRALGDGDEVLAAVADDVAVAGDVGGTGTAGDVRIVVWAEGDGVGGKGTAPGAAFGAGTARICWVLCDCGAEGCGIGRADGVGTGEGDAGDCGSGI